MKKSFTFITFMLFAFFIGNTIAYGATRCTDKELAGLNKTASAIKANYEIKTKEITTTYTYYADEGSLGEEKTEQVKVQYFSMSVYNVTKDVYLTITNDNNKDEIIVNYENTDKGTYTFTSDDFDNIIKYNIVVSSNLDNCGGNVIKTFTFIKPKKNAFSNYEICQKYPSVSYCKEYITEDLNISETELHERLSKYIAIDNAKNKKSTTANKITTFLKTYYLYIIGSIVLITLIIFIVKYIIKKRSTL